MNHMPAVCSRQCGECLFSKSKIVSDRRRAKLLRDCLKNDQPFICHKGSMVGHDHLYCRGFVDAYPGHGQAIRLAIGLGILHEQDPEDLSAPAVNVSEIYRRGRR